MIKYNLKTCATIIYVLIMMSIGLFLLNVKEVRSFVGVKTRGDLIADLKSTEDSLRAAATVNPGLVTHIKDTQEKAEKTIETVTVFYEHKEAKRTKVASVKKTRDDRVKQVRSKLPNNKSLPSLDDQNLVSESNIIALQSTYQELFEESK